jgi:hypothetical protein
MGVIKSATYGDSYSNTDVLSSVSKQAKDGKTAVRVDSSLVPMIDKATGANTVTLTRKEKQLAFDQAVQTCGSANDQACIAKTRTALEETRLKEKQEASTQDSIQIAGNYLTVVCVDDAGKERKIKVPEGKEFDLSVCSRSGPTSRTPPLDLKAATNSFRTAWNTLWSSSGYAILTFLYVSSILITWMTVRKTGSPLMAYGLTAVSAVIPYSGFFIAIGGPAAYEFFAGLRARYLQTQAAMNALPKNPLGNP